MAMDTAKQRKILFVINPISGGKSKGDLEQAIRAFCNVHAITYKIYCTTGSPEDKNTIKSILEQFDADAIVAGGGDGTVNLVGSILVGTPVPIGILPAGSANGLAKDLGIPEDVEDALSVIARFHSKKIDTLKINQRNCFHLSDFGFNARVCHRFADSFLRGKISYIWFGLQEFFSFTPFPYKIETPISVYEGCAFMMTVTNANKFGTNASINPLGEIDDGFFEISIIKPFPKLASLGILYRLMNNTIYKSPYYKIIRCKKAIIHNKMNESFHIDGEPVELGEKIEVNIVDKGLNVLMP